MVLGSMISLFWWFVVMAYVIFVFSLTIRQGVAHQIMTACKSPDHTEVAALMDSFKILPRTMRTWCIVATGGNVWKYTLTGSSLLVPFTHVPYVCTHCLYAADFSLADLKAAGISPADLKLRTLALPI